MFFCFDVCFPKHHLEVILVCDLYKAMLKEARDALSSASVLAPDVEAMLVTLEKEKQPTNSHHWVPDIQA